MGKDKNKVTVAELSQMSRNQKIFLFALDSTEIKAEKRQVVTFIVDKDIYPQFDLKCVQQGVIWDEAFRQFMISFVNGDFHF